MSWHDNIWYIVAALLCIYEPPSLIEHSNTVFQKINGDVIEKGKEDEEYHWYHNIKSMSASKYHEAISGASVH